ncbi:MAG: succinylglutamate desuccinylase/aspartoacylase family protein [Candidatus Krumholzibacteria bacterium]
MSGDPTQKHEAQEVDGLPGGRVIGRYGEPDGPLLIVVAGLHGNEPAGVEACRRLFERLGSERSAMQGRAVAFIGNLTALEREERFVDRDLNRMWSTEDLAVLGGDSSHHTVEQREQRELIASMESELDNGRHPVIVIDLHSTSAFGAPFCIISDTLQNRRIAFPWSVPVILGLEEAIHGTIQEYFGARGYITAAVEGGQHRDPETADRLESVLWITLVTAGFLRESDVPGLSAHRDCLRRVSRGLPSVVEVFYRHGLVANNGFEMQPGFRNFSTVRRGQRVARDGDGDIVARANGLLILPNYQKSGNDGFFLGRRVPRFWLQLSTLVRKARMDRLLTLLPGVQRQPSAHGDVVVKAGGRLAPRILHLMGYQKRASDGRNRVYRRRPEGPA